MTNNIKESEEQKKAKEVVNAIASNLIELSNSVSALLNGKLKKKSLVLLLAWSSGIPQYQVEKVLHAIVDLEKDHTN